MTQNIKNQCIFVSTQIRYNDGMFFYEQQEYVHDFPSLSLATCASAGVSELFLSTSGKATSA